MYIIIVGGGKVGYHLAKMLSEDSHEIGLIEKSKAVCLELAQELSDVLVIQGDGCDSRNLKDAGAENADVIAAVTGSDEDNLVISQLAKEIFNIPRTVARVNDPKNEHIFNELGVDVPVNSTSIIARIIEEEASLEDFVELMALKKGKISLIRVDLTEESPAVGKSLSDIDLPSNCAIATVLRGEDVIVPNESFVLKEGDDVIVVAPIENEEDVLEKLLGKIEL
jgi:trk system potassium uptake protein TrkA